MRNPTYLLLAVFFAVLGFRHPMHVSVTEIEYRPENKSLQITTHIFLDDIEKNYRHATGRTEADITTDKEKGAFNNYLGTYLSSELQLTVNNKPTTGHYLGFEIEGNGIWCYIEIEGVKKLKSLEVKNSILLETFDDQTNLVHFEHNDDIQSAKLDKKKTKVVFEIEV